MIQQRHHRHWHKLQGTENSGVRRVQQARDLMIATPCALHDVMTALRWAMKDALDHDEMKQLYLVIEALRNGARYMFRILDSFVDQFVECRVDPLHDAANARLFWQSLGVADA